VVLKKGAVLTLRVDEGSANDGKLMAQVSGVAYTDTNFWLRPRPGMLVTRRLAGGPHTVRSVRLDGDGTTWFSEVIAITAVAGQTNELAMKLKRGVTVRGQLYSTVPRPVKNGRVVAYVWPRGCDTKKSPPQWHGWSAVSDDGEFAIHSMPEGDLEIVAMCEGFISTNGPGQFQTRYPQKHVIRGEKFCFPSLHLYKQRPMKSTGRVAPRCFSVRPHKRLRGAQTNHEPSAFTLIECLAVMAALALLACVALPVLAGTKYDSQRIFCVNNLRQIGQAWAGWGNEHGDLKPPNLDWPSLAGNPNAMKVTAWRHYYFLSNHLATPRPLVCPVDSRARAAANWSSSAGSGGFGHIVYQDQALSYFIGLHPLAEYPREIIGGDIGIGGVETENCGVTGVQASLLAGGNASIEWTNKPHMGTGNLLLNDGQVRPTTSDQLRAMLQSPGRYRTNETHLVAPNR
jgi:prepilin-type N-terminal cleavage/methylation domain-containing protein